MGNDLDTGLLGLLENRFENLGIIRHDADVIDLLSNQVFDGANLQRRVGTGRTNHEAFNAKLGTLLLDARLHGIKPRDAADLHHDTNLRTSKGR